MPPNIPEISSGYSDIALVALLLVLIVAALCFAIFLGWWLSKQRDSLCPYTGAPLKRGEYLSFYAKEQILRFLYEHHSFENRMFKLNKSALCRDTGRIFPDAMTWYDTLYVDWNFLQKRYPGNYVSWGSLSKDQQDAVKRAHGSLAGFQTNFSSPSSSPKDIAPDFVFMKPGPLYVDLGTMIVLGWKLVPGTDFEIMIVQKPIHYIISPELKNK